MRALRILVLSFLLLPSVAWALDTAQVTIKTNDGRSLDFTVELAKTPEEQRVGLMNRPSLPANGGMLFDFGMERPVAMWMENTLIPLDMIFIANDGKILGIAERTVPMSREIIASPGPARAVLEVNGGTADRLHIKTGDRLEAPLWRN
jgi:uncharacterized membrane protein (UPF0127 family)